MMQIGMIIGFVTSYPTNWLADPRRDQRGDVGPRTFLCVPSCTIGKHRFVRENSNAGCHDFPDALPCDEHEPSRPRSVMPTDPES